MRQRKNNNLNLFNNKRQRYGIRKCTVGTASLLVGTILIFGTHAHDAEAAEVEQEAVKVDSHLMEVPPEETQVAEKLTELKVSHQAENIEEKPVLQNESIQNNEKVEEQWNLQEQSIEVPTQSGSAQVIDTLQNKTPDVTTKEATSLNAQVQNVAQVTEEKIPTTATASEAQTGTYRIGDLVWEDVNKNGRQDPGEPGVPNVRVELKDLNSKVLKTVFTDENGHYIFSGIKKGRYYVQFYTPKGYTPTRIHEHQTTPENDSNGRVTLVDITDKDDLNADFGVFKNANEAEKTYKVGDLVWEDVNKNGRQDPGEPGIPGVTVIILNDQEKEIGRTVTDAQGHYTFKHIKNGRYSVIFETPKGYQPTIDRAPQVPQDLDSNYISTIVDVKDGDNLTIDSGFFKTNPTPPTPEEPKSPEHPNMPKNPDQPEPKVPEHPNEPSQPAPQVPEQPIGPKEATPKEPVPALPEAPGHEKQQPKKPGNKEIVIPSKPLMPSETVTPDKKVNPKPILPNTGKEETDTTLWGTLLISLGALFAVVRRPKRANKE
ncbi:hypothetical protein SSCHL_0287 [Staphylococcus schleiferi]|nr:hypothetical protein SSCHL_0287 [Staphylococcus schleiferi]